jgi:transposase-like protein
VIPFTMRFHASGDAMIGRETRMLLRHYLAQGASKSALARQLGISRDTIHRWIRDGDLDRDLEAAPTRYAPTAGGPHEAGRV